MLYAIKNRRSGKFVTGTDFRNGKRQIMDESESPLILSDYDGEIPEAVETELRRRKINKKQYKIVPVRVVEVREGD